MLIVVDVNVVLSSLLGLGNSFDIFAANFSFNKFEFIAPEFFLTEFERHKSEIIKRSKLSSDEFKSLLEIIVKQINFIPADDFKDFLGDSIKILGKHLKDVQYLSLALKYNCPIFSGDKILKQIIPNKVLTPKDMLEILFNE